MKTALLAACSFVSFAVAAQSKKFVFTLGEEYELPKKTEDLSFFGNSVDGIVNLALKNDEIHVVRFDNKKLNVTTQKVIPVKEATKNFNSEILVDFGPNHYWLHSDWDKSSEREYLYYDKIEVASNKISVSDKLLLETSKIAGGMDRNGHLYGIKTIGKYKFNFDAQHQKLLVSYRLVPEERNDKNNYDKIGLFVFDEKMNKLWGREYTMPYTEAIMDNSDFSVDDQGNAYMLAKVYDSDSRREKDKSTGLPAYHFEVFKFTADNKKILKASVIPGDFFPKEVSLIENSLHEMVVASTYSKKPNSHSTDGIFLAIMDREGKINKYRNGYYEFPIEELEKFESARNKRKMEKKTDYEAPNLKVRNLLVESDGSVLIALEKSFVVTNTYTNSNGSIRTTYTYYNEDIIATKINAGGRMEWVRKIPKRQKGGSPLNTMSFKLVSDQTGYYFLYLDNIKNMNISEGDEPKYHLDGAGGQVIVSKVDNAGNVSKELLFDTRDEDVMIFPSQFSRLDVNSFVGRARVKKTLYKPVLIKVKI